MAPSTKSKSPMNEAQSMGRESGGAELANAIRAIGGEIRTPIGARSATPLAKRAARR